MISFACDGCGRAFSVPESFAGRKATCKTCGAKVVVPGMASAPVAVAASRAVPSGGAAVANGNGHSAVTQSAAPATVVKPALVNPAAALRRTPDVAVADQAAPATLVVPPGAQLMPAPGDESATADERQELLADESSVETQSPPAKLPMRIRRLMVDAEQMQQAYSGKGPIRIKAKIGDPPELYQIEYKVSGLARGWFGKPKKRDTHLVEIQLTSEYPRMAPQCKMLTKVFHPNIDETTICVGDHWTAGERLVDLVARIAEMLAYQAYNIKSPLNGEAAMWADLNSEKLPVDSRNFQPGDGV
jgi:ubiquitin-protein ligase/DNA-directed RNA polymerase subunit RPC12/RpoP